MRLDMAHVLFMDLVGYSRLPLEEQNQRIEALQEVVRGREAVQIAEADGTLLAHPAGDGMALAFFGDPSAPARCALEVSEAIRSRDDLPLRIGIHSGPVYQAEDINRTANVRGPGINVAQRVMDCADAGHILLSYTTADALLPLSAWEDRLFDLGEVEVKHGLRLRLYGLTNGEGGADAPSARIRELREQWSAEHRAHNLPASLTSFIGREEQIEEVKQRLRETRLLTLTGMGGTGKTRLSLRVGEEALDEYPDGVWFVELASISDPNLIVSYVAAVLDVRESGDQALMVTLTRYLAGQRALLILDNCEHLIEDASRFAQEFLVACPGPTILATSREVLGVNGEATWRVPSLSLPTDVSHSAPEEHTADGGSEAVQLFADRARAARSDFVLDDRNAEIVAAICRRLDGIPLAIELASARVRAMSVEEIHERLDDRFRLLTGGGRASPRRQQTLRSLIDWSYRLLEEAEQSLFCRLAVFQGGFTMEAAEDVCAFNGVESWDVLDLLLQMVDKSLVIAEEGVSGTRYRMLETLREYGLDRLIEDDHGGQVRRLHTQYFAQVAQEQFREDGEAPQGTWQVFHEEHANLIAALEWCSDNDTDLGLQIGADVAMYWFHIGYWHQAADWYERLADATRNSMTSARVRVLAYLARLYWFLPVGRDRLLSVAQEALKIAEALDDTKCLARAYSVLVNAHAYTDADEALRCNEKATELWQQVGHMSGVARGLYIRAFHERSRNWRHAKELLEETIRMARDANAPGLEAVSLDLLAAIEIDRGDPLRAGPLLDRAISHAKETDGAFSLATAYGHMACYSVKVRDYGSAHAYYHSAWRAARKYGETKFGSAHTHLTHTAAAALLLGKTDEALSATDRVLTSLAHHDMKAADAKTGLLPMAARVDGAEKVAALLIRSDVRLAHSDIDGSLEATSEALRVGALLASGSPRGKFSVYQPDTVLDRIARIAVATGQYDSSVRLHAVVRTLRDEYGRFDLGAFPCGFDHMQMSEQLGEPYLANAKERLDARGFNRAWDAGRALNDKEAFDLARGVIDQASAMGQHGSR